MIISSLDSVIIAENDGLGNAVEKKTGTSGYSYNACTHRKNCKKKNVCGIECTRKSAYSCRFCSHCNTSCTDFKEEVCTVLNKAPYKSLFPVILTDNGSEYSNPKGIEYDDKGLSVSRVFYCDAGSPYQKGAIEVNHELIRRILPKGSSFDDLTQDDEPHQFL